MPEIEEVYQAMMIIGLILCCGVAAAQLPSWPLDMTTRYLTGNFMEPRDGSYHAGLDLKTDSQTGYPVLAVQDGHVSRVRLSVSGYGQALYLTTADGTVYVYGHLERLRDDLRAAVQARQYMQESYEVDLWFHPHEWPVHRGQVLALSGQSATLGPHLHFEVRGPDGQPRDPLAHGFSVADAIAPEILAVRAIRTDGQDPPSLLLIDGKKPLQGRLADLRLEQGPLFFSALIIERSDRQNHLLGPWRVRLMVDGREVYGAVNDHLRWDNRHHQRLEYIRTALGHEQVLRVDDRNQLAGRYAAAWLSDGRWPAGKHDIELVAEDRAGNRSVVSWTLVVENGFRSTQAEKPIATAGGTAAGGGKHAPAGAIMMDWQPGVDVVNDPWLLDLSDPGLAAGFLPQDSLAWAAAPLREPVPTRFWHLSGLKTIGMPVQYRLENAWALMQAVAVIWPESGISPNVDADDPAFGVYRLRRRAWTYAGSLRADPGSLIYDLRQPGVYQVMRDQSPPFIATASVATNLEKQPPRQRGGITMPTWPVLKVPVGDHGSGVDWERLQTWLNGNLLIVEPDPPRDRILVELPETLEPGSHDLTIAICDRAGHRASAKLALNLVDPASDTSYESLEGKDVMKPAP